MSLLTAIIDYFLQLGASRSSRPSRLFNRPPSEPPPPPDKNFSIPLRIYAEHGAIFAPSGHGKTQLLQHLIFDLLNSHDDLPIWVIDSQGDMLNLISRLDAFNPDDGHYKDRLVLVDPEDANPPALNLFSLGGEDAATDDLFLYMFTAIDNSLTPQQSTTVTYLMRLMRIIPNATIDTLRQVLEDRSKSLDASPWAGDFRRLDQLAQDFFANHFYHPGPMQLTRNSIARRLYALLANPVFRRMFGAPTNRFDPLKALDEKHIVLINTSAKLLGEGASVLGRFFIAQALNAAYRRPPNQRHPALLIVDEASEYFDYQTERILSTARKFGLGLLTASQFLSQMDEKTKAAIHGNTAIKIAGPVSFQDANALGREMYVDGDFIRGMRKFPKHAEFACFVRSLTPKAIQVNAPFFTLENAAKMTPEQYVRLRQANRERYGTTDAAQPRPTVHPHETTVTLVDYGVTHPCLLDSGASMTTIPAENMTTVKDVVSFTLLGTTITAPIERMQSLTGFSGETLTCPVIKLKIRIGTHEAVEDCALNRPGSTFLIGRTFMAGRILVEPKDARW